MDTERLTKEKLDALFEALWDKGDDEGVRLVFMPGCTHAGVVKGTTCPFCGRMV